MTSVVTRRALLGGAAAVLLLPSRVAYAQRNRTFPEAQGQISLNGEWRFALALTPADADALAGFHAQEFDAARFVKIPVPSNWAVLGFEEPQYKEFKDRVASEGFYLREFRVPSAWKDRRVLLHFNGVWASAEVWLNGQRLGRHDSGFTSFGYDVSAELSSDRPNTLAVRVRQDYPGYQFDINDDWSLGGIFGDVWLEAMPAMRWIDAVQVETVFDDQFEEAVLKLRLMVADAREKTGPVHHMSRGQPPYELEFTLLDRDGSEVVRRRISVPAHLSTGRESRISFNLARPHHWNAESPYLYTLHVDLFEGEEPVHRRTQRIGIRQISTAGGVFRINGQAVKLRGVNRHEEHPDVGRATSRKHWLEDITLMKAANINYVRCAHYPPAKGFLELCDELGMYVGDEIPMNGAVMNDPSSAEGAMLRAYEAVARDINHPSVVYWSVGNEDPLTSLHLGVVKAVKALDPSRPVLLPWRFEDSLPPEVDIIAPHYWQPDEYDVLGGHSGRPVISTEYTHAYGLNGMGSLKERWESLTRHPAGAGAAIWMWADQGLRTKGEAVGISKQPGLRLTSDGWDGITDSYRKPTRDYWEAKAVYAQVYPAVDVIDFTPGQHAALVPIQNDFDFTDLGAIRIEWQIMEDDRQLAAGAGSVTGRPHSSVLFSLPLEAVRRVRSNAAYYAWFSFRDAQGAEIARRTVELRSPMSLPTTPIILNPVSVERGEPVIVRVGTAEYRFDPKTGTLAAASLNGRTVIAELKPSLWRKLDENELYVGGRNIATLPDLNAAAPTVKQWNVRDDEGSVAITAVVEYVVDPRNRYVATYDYLIAPDGRLHVHYAYEPTVEASWLPHVGMVVRSVDSLDRVRWLGLGPLDAYPNKKAAAILGVWSGAAGSAEVVGVRKTRWVELGNAGGRIRLANDGYLYSDPDAPDTFHLLSAVFGRPEKQRQPNEPVPQLATGPRTRFVGEFVIAPLMNQS